MKKEKKCCYITPKGKQKSFKNIKLITFDLDNTIWNVKALLDYADNECYKYLKKNYNRIYDYLLKEHEMSIPKIEKKLLSQNSYFEEDDFNYYTKIRIKTLKYLAKQTNYDEIKVSSELIKLWNEKKNDVYLFINAGTIEYLQELKSRGYILGAITNGDSDFNKIKFLNEIFSFVIRSMDYNVSKPNVKIFNVVDNILKEKNIKLNANEWLHVGDDILTDVIGSKNKNIRCAWITIYRSGKEVSESEWYSYLKLKFEKSDDSTLTDHDPYEDDLHFFQKQNIILPYEYIDVEIRHCKDLDQILP